MFNMNGSFTVFGEDWGRHPSSTQHIFKHMMKDHDVQWINSIGMRSPKISQRDFGRVFEKGKSFLKKSTGDHGPGQTPKVYQPKLLPFHGTKYIQYLNKQLFKRCDTSVLWTSLPTSVYLHDNVKSDCTVYYCGDDFGALEGVDHEMVAIHEKKLAEQADIILTINDDLAQKFPKHKTYILDHGVDFDLFSRPKPSPHDLPNKQKIAGFYGSIQSWVDLDLIEKLARGMDDWTFVFIGNVHVSVEQLETYPNIQFLGPKAHDELPAYVQNWDVSLFPFKQNDQIDACNPLKLKEYMAAGTPIVSTQFPAVDVFKDNIFIANRAGFAPAIRKAFEEEKSQRIVRQDLMKEHSWESRAQSVRDIIQNHLMA